MLDGDYAAGIAAIDASMRRLEGMPGKSADRAVAQLYAGVALVARGETVAGRERFRKALLEDASLTLSAEQFPPKVTALFAAARTELERGGQAPAVSSPRLLRSLSGSRGAARGSQFLIEDARSSFEPRRDRQAVVWFEWEAAAGRYGLLGTWRDPKGSAVPQPQVEATSAGGRLEAYWVLSLPESMASGQWTLEVSCDGRTVGQHAIQVLAGKTEPQSDAPSDDLYATVAPSLVLIERRDADGRAFGRGLGFFVEGGLVATAFQVVEGARSLRVVLADQRSLVTDRIAAWNRWQDWALVAVPGAPEPALALSTQLPPNGGKCRVIDLDGEERPYLGRAVVVSSTRPPGLAGERLRLGVAGGVTEAASRLLLPREAAGGPLLGGSGDVVGILGGSLVPGESSGDGRLALGASLATPASLVTMPRADGAITLGELIARAESLEPSRRSELVRVALGKGLQGSDGSTALQDETTELSLSDRALVAQASWEPTSKRSVSVRGRILDLDGAPTAEAEPSRLQFEAGKRLTSLWHFDLSKLPAGVHRVEVRLDSAVVWRGYFRLSP